MPRCPWQLRGKQLNIAQANKQGQAVDKSTQMCFAFKKGKCTYDKCRFSHSAEPAAAAGSTGSLPRAADSW